MVGVLAGFVGKEVEVFRSDQDSNLYALRVRVTKNGADIYVQGVDGKRDLKGFREFDHVLLGRFDDGLVVRRIVSGLGDDTKGAVAQCYADTAKLSVWIDVLRLIDRKSVV